MKTSASVRPSVEQGTELHGQAVAMAKLGDERLRATLFHGTQAPPRLRDLRASRPEPRKGPGGAHPCGAVASSLNDARIRNLRRSMRDSIRHSFRSTIAPSNPSFQSRDAEQVLRPIVGHYRSTDWQILGKPVQEGISVGNEEGDR